MRPTVGVTGIAAKRRKGHKKETKLNRSPEILRGEMEAEPVAP
jgi:hypothetical protein